MIETRLYFLRHGVTDWNTEGRWQGQADISLNERGRQQADAAAEYLQRFNFDHIYSSDLDRALATAKAVAQKQGNSKVIETAAWQERCVGVFSGLTSHEIQKKYPQAFDQMMRGWLEPPEGESFVDLSARVEKELARLVKEHRGESVLVVSHGGTIRGVGHVTLGVPQDKIWSLQVGNTALSLLISSPRGWKLEFWNDNHHLAEAGLESDQPRLTL